MPEATPTGQKVGKYFPTGRGDGGGYPVVFAMRTARRSKDKRPKTAPLVLVADDDANARRLFEDYLTMEGFRVVTAPDGLTAVERASRDKPNVIVMDLAMPHVDGWNATRQLKRNPATARIPVIACTAHVLGGSVERALDAGVDAYITKPCPPDVLVKEIRKILRLFAAKRDA